MGIILVDNSNNFTPLEEGVYYGVCRQIIDLGRQKTNGQFGEKISRQVYLQWELPDEMLEINGVPEPRRVGKIFTASFSEKSNLRKTLESWRGKKFTEDELHGFDLDNVLGKGCQVQIVHSKKEEKTYENVNAIMCLPKGMKLDPPSDTYSFVLEQERLKEIEEMPDWMQKKIKESLTYAELTGSSVEKGEDDFSGFNDVPGFGDDEVPFA